MKKVFLLSTTILLGVNTLFAQDAWLNNVMGGFNTHNSQSNGLHVFNNLLYTITGKDSGSVYRTSTGQRNSWEKVFNMPGVNSVNAINSTSGNIYVSAHFGYDYTNSINHDSTVIYRSPDGSGNWAPYFQFLGNANFIVPFNGGGATDSIYIVKNVAGVSEIWKSSFYSNDPDNTTNSWNQTALNMSGYSVTSTCVHSNIFYTLLLMGTGSDVNGSGPAIWGSFNGNSWAKFTTPAFDTSISISAMASFGGALYVGTENNNGAQIWKTIDTTSWTLVGQYPGNAKVTSLQVNAGELWATLEGVFMDYTGTAKIIRNVNSQPYNYSTNNGFGIEGLNGANGSTIKFGNNIYYACSYSSTTRTESGDNGSQIWKLCLSTPPALNLGPDVTVCEGVTHTFDAGAGTSSYVWCDESTNQTLDASYPQDYFVTVMGPNGCESADTVTLKNIPSPTISGNYLGLPPLCKGDTLPPIHISITFSQVDTNVTFSLFPATGLSSTNSSPVLAYPTTSTVYTITATNGTNACSSYDSIRVEVPALKINQHEAHICFGSPDSLSAGIIGLSQNEQTNQEVFHWSNNIGLTDSIASGITVTPASTTTYYVMGTVSASHCIVWDTTDVNVSPPMTIDAGISQTICFHDTATLNAQILTGGTAPYTYLWDDGNTISTDQPYLVSPDSNSYYTLKVTDAWGCSSDSTTDVLVTPSTDIYGHVDSAGVSITNGFVAIYKYLPYQSHFDVIDSVSIDSNGDYHFLSINHGTYLIKVFPDTADYPTAMPTYFGNQFLWTAATAVNHNCDFNDTADISVLFPVSMPVGIGSLGGIIREGIGFVRQEGDPIPGLDVKIGKNPGGIIASAQTDSSGYYYFGNLALNSVVGGSYTIYADIPGVGMASSYTVALDPVHPSYDSLNYVVDSTTIDTVAQEFTTGIINTINDATTHFTIYPNPCKGNTVIEYSTSIEARVTLEVVNVLGVKIKSLVNSKQSAGNHKCNLNNQSKQLSPGVYFITLTIDGKESTQRMVVLD